RLALPARRRARSVPDQAVVIGLAWLLTGSRRAYDMHRGSGDKQAVAKLGRVELDEVAVAFGPPAGCEVITEAAHCPLLGVRPDSGPDRHSAADMLVQIRLGPAPVGVVEAVSAVPRNEHRLGPSSYCAGQFGQRRSASPEAGELGQVVTIQPEET